LHIANQILRASGGQNSRLIDILYFFINRIVGFIMLTRQHLAIGFCHAEFAAFKKSKYMNDIKAALLPLQKKQANYKT
jgi:hypothetical protein